MVYNTFEGGTDSTNITVVNSGGASGTAFTQVIINNAGPGGGGVNLQYRTAAAARGTMGCRFTPDATLPSYLRLDTTDTATRYVVRARFKTTGTPVGATVLFGVYAAGNTPLVGQFTILANNKLRMNRGSSPVSATDSTNVVVPGTWYALEFAYTIETGAGSNGVMEYAWYDNTDTLIETKTVTGQLTGTTAPQVVRSFPIAANSGITEADLDELQIVGLNGTGNWIGPFVPTVNAGVDQTVAAASTVNLTATATSTGSTVSPTTGHNWTYVFPVAGGPALTGASTSTPSFTSGTAGNLYILQDVVSDGGAVLSASDTVEIRVPKTGAFSHLAIVGTGAAWTNVGGAATDGQALADGSDTTYLESPGISAVETTRRVRIVPIDTRTGMVFTERFATSSGTANVKVRLYEGNILREEFIQAITGTPTNYTFTLASGTVTAIGDFGNLFIEVAATT